MFEEQDTGAIVTADDGSQYHCTGSRDELGQIFALVDNRGNVDRSRTFTLTRSETGAIVATARGRSDAFGVASTFQNYGREVDVPVTPPDARSVDSGLTAGAPSAASGLSSYHTDFGYPPSYDSSSSSDYYPAPQSRGERPQRRRERVIRPQRSNPDLRAAAENPDQETGVPLRRRDRVSDLRQTFSHEQGAERGRGRGGPFHAH
jgi:hypothetical protein